MDGTVICANRAEGLGAFGAGTGTTAGLAATTGPGRDEVAALAGVGGGLDFRTVEVTGTAFLAVETGLPDAVAALGTVDFLEAGADFGLPAGGAGDLAATLAGAFLAATGEAFFAGLGATLGAVAAVFLVTAAVLAPPVAFVTAAALLPLTGATTFLAGAFLAGAFTDGLLAALAAAWVWPELTALARSDGWAPSLERVIP